jgi:hypothetical protein
VDLSRHSEMSRQSRVTAKSGWTRRNRGDYVSRTMIDPPHKSGWYWILQAHFNAVPEVAFLTISDVLQLEQVAICSEEPIRSAASMRANAK